MPSRRFQPGPPRNPPPSSVDEVARAAGFDVLGPLDSGRLGQGRHRVIGELIERYGPQPDELTRRSFVASHAAAVSRHSAKNANPYMKAVQDLQLTVASYFINLAPLGPWTLVGRERVVPGQRFDLVWRDPAGRVWVEELKTHRMPMRERVALDEQVPRYLPAANEHWGDAFAGLRICLVMTPFRSYSLTANGERIELVR